MIERSEQPVNYREPIAVIGLGCWYPGARNPKQFWENILARRLEFRSIPDERLPLSDYCDASGESIDKIYAKRAAVIDGFEFDWIGRRIPKSLFESTDLVHWLSVEVAEQAIHDAGYTKDTLDKASTGVIIGNTLTGDVTRAETLRLRWPFVRRALQASCEAHGLPDEAFRLLGESMEKLYKSAFTEPGPDSLAGGLANVIAGRVCNYFDLHGGGYIVDGACASSLLAVCTAARALASGDLNAAIVGGVDISLDPFELVGFSRAGALSKGDMNVYDKAAAGFIPGEGCGFVMLKRLADARRDGDQVYSVLRGWGVSSDGKGGIMTPTSSGQALAIRRAYSEAGYSPADLDFVEGHGTGTKVGDMTELKGVHEAQTHGHIRDSGQPAPPAARRTGMTSLKSIIGHTKAAAGIGAFIKATLAVNRRVLPPTGSCTTPNPVFNDTCHSLYPLMHGTVLDPVTAVRGGVSAMGFGGINSHVTIESGDAPNPNLAPSLDETALLASNQTSEIFVLAAESFAELGAEIDQLLQTAHRLSYSDLIDLSAELANRAKNSTIRAVIVATSAEDFAGRLQALKVMVEERPPALGEASSSERQDIWLSNQCDQSRIGFLFPGQGSQQLAMARKLVGRFNWAREMVAAADRVQVSAGLPTISQTVFENVQRAIGREQSAVMKQVLARTEIAQVAIVTVSMIYARFLKMMGVEPVVCAGHSLGELTALHQSGAFDFETLLQLVSLRGRAMASPAEEAGAMVALSCTQQTAETLIADTPGYAVLANINSPKQSVVAGEGNAIQAILAKAAENGIPARRLNVSNAFHSNFVSQAAEILRQQAPVPQRPERMDIEVISCIDGQPLGGDVDLRHHLADQVVERVDFVSTLQSIGRQCDLLVEVGPGNVLTKLSSDTLGGSDSETCSPVASKPEVECCLNHLLAKAFAHGVDVQWSRLFENRLSRTFVPVTERVFISNPCESNLVDLGEVEAIGLKSSPQDLSSNSPSAMQGVEAIVADGFEDLASDTATRASVPLSHTTNIDNQDILTAMSSNNELAPSQLRESQTVDDGIDASISRIISERTGFPVETITPELRLLDDLNLDSIKAGDIVATAARELDTVGEVDPANLGDATVGDIAAALRLAQRGDAGLSLEQTTRMSSDSTPAALDPPMQANALVANMPAAALTASPSIMSQLPSAAQLPASPLARSAAQVPVAPVPVAPVANQDSLLTPTSILPAQAESKDDGINDVILQIIQERTGFPKETLTSDLRLLDDLNLDSIKAGDIVATATRQVGAEGEVDPANLGDATIADVVSAVRLAKYGQMEAPMTSEATAVSPAFLGAIPPSAPARSEASLLDTVSAHLPAKAPVPSSESKVDSRQMPLPPLSPAASVSPAAPASAVSRASTVTTGLANGVSTGAVNADWVRNFAVEFVEHRPTAEQRDISGLHFRVLYDPSHQYFNELLARRVAERRATASFETYDGQGRVTGQARPDGTSLYTIALLPREVENGTSREKLERMIHRNRRAAASTSAAAGNDRAIGVAFIEFGNGRFGTEGITDVERSGAAAFARALHLEMPTLQVRVIDFADELSDFLATDFVTNEIAADEMFLDAAYDRLGRRFETRHRLLQPAESTPLPLALSNSDVIMVTGGARGITAECALALAQKTGANFALIGSSPHPDQSAGRATDEIAAILKRFADLPGKCEYFSCDLTDVLAVRNLVAEVDARLGKITGLVHGAGRNAPRAASATTAEQALAEVSPKVLGAANLLEALATRPLRCLVGLTSIIGVTGIPGNAWYAFSNETLDLVLRQYKSRHPEALVRSLSYSAWSEVGMGAQGQVEANLRRMGVGMIPLREGVARFMHAMEHELDDVQMLVTASLGGIDTWRPGGRDKCSSRTRFVDEILSFEPGVYLKTRVKIDFETDPYLQDHIYSGTCLFPAVLGMEAMAQVAAHLMPERPSVIRLQNVDLPRPIIVGQEGQVVIEIHAEAAEKNAAGETVVKVGMRTERTQFQYDHFSADVVFGELAVGASQPEVVGNRLDIDPQRDLYNGIMFQGPRFQRWGDTYHLEHGMMRFQVLHSDATCRGEEVFGSGVHKNALMTGDPFFRDVMLQSIQALIPQKIGLPLSIEKIEFFGPANPDGMQANNRLVMSKMNVIGENVGEEHICEVVAKDPCGHIREHMVGYRVKVLAIKENYPTAAQLADLAAYEQMLFDKQTISALAELGAQPPVMTLKRLPELHAMSKADRHVLEQPMMDETASRFLQQDGGSTVPAKISWLDSGRPIVGKDDRCKISLSHDDDYCLCIANSIVAGCDLAPITSRSREQWQALVGSDNAPLLDQLMSLGDCIDTAGTRIWAAVEAAQKSIDQAIAVPLRIAMATSRSVSFTAESLGDAVLVTLPISLHRRPQRIVAIVAPKAMVSPIMSTQGIATSSADLAPASGSSQSASSRDSSLVAAQPMSAMSIGSLVPAKPAAMGGPSEPPRSQAEMLAMAKMATAAMSPQEAGMVEDATPMANAAESAMSHTSMLSPSLPTPAMPAPAMPNPSMASPSVPSASVPSSILGNVSPATQSENDVRGADIAPPGETRVIDKITAVHLWDGPQEQAVFEYKFLVTFKECAMKGKQVQQAQFIDWMGWLRENALLYLCPEMAHKLSNGLSGMATNWTDIDIVGEAMMGDMVVARFFREEMTDATVNLVCDFAKLLPDGRTTRVAVVRQAATWVALEGKKDPVKAVFPKFLADALRLVSPRSSEPPKYPELPETLGRLKIEQQKLEATKPHVPVVLWSENFQTTTADSNIVQNLYHSRYFNWQWRTSDLFLYSVVPQLVSRITSIGNVKELLPLNGHIDYVRDAFPFDRIQTELAVLRSTDCAATLQFTHYRVNEAGELQKLSVCKQDVVWIRRTHSATPVPEPFPRAVKEAMQGAPIRA